MGDSFVVPGGTDRSILYNGSRNAGIKVQIAKDGDKLRVWRIE